MNARAASVLAAVLAVFVGLTWIDVLPGGWRLRRLLLGPDVVAERERSHHRQERLRELAGPAASGPADVLFIGSSTIEFLDADLWAQRAPYPCRAVNHGIGDEPLAKLKERWRSTLVRTSPRAVVLYAGSVDLRRPTGTGQPGAKGPAFRPVDELLADVSAMVADALDQNSNLSIWVLGVLTSRDPDAKLLDRVRSYNRGLERIAAAESRLRYVATNRSPLVDPSNGAIDGRFTDDGLHLNAAGYEILSGWMRTAIPEERLGRRAPEAFSGRE